MSKDRPISLHECSMAKHPHVKGDIVRRFSIRIEEFKSKVLRRSRSECRRHLPKHRVTVRKPETLLLRSSSRATLKNSIRRRFSIAVIYSYRYSYAFRVIAPQRATRDRRKNQRRNHGFWKAICMDHIGKEVIVAGRHGGQCEPKFSASRLFRMEMKDYIHIRPSNRIEVHEVIVVGDKVVHPSLG